MPSDVKDPVCGKDVDPLRARAVGIFGGQTFYFCSQECKGKFVDPRKPAEGRPQPMLERRKGEPTGERPLAAPETAAPQDKAKDKGEKTQLAKKGEKKAEKKAEPKAANEKKAEAPEPARAEAKPEPSEPATEAAGGEAEPVPERPPSQKEAPAARPPAAVEPDDEVARDPSPSVEAEIEAARGGAGRAWLLVIVLFAATGVILFLAFR